MAYSKTKIDKAGEILSKSLWKTESEFRDCNAIFDTYRSSFIEPLIEGTRKLQSWLEESNFNFYIAERLKRKPQIIKKLNRFDTTRLSQLQDIGGIRIIFDQNKFIDEFVQILKDKISHGRYFEIVRETDYRSEGRKDSGYRAVHIIIKRKGKILELQLRSQIQHNWAERIERTSVIYGHALKELEGNREVIKYFKLLSNIFHGIENDQWPDKHQINDLESERIACEEIIKNSDTMNLLNSSINENYIRGMVRVEAGLRGQFHNWMIVFNWRTGNFENWQLVQGKSEEAIKLYADTEEKWSANDGYEVVMIGSSDVETISKTHSHYFGIENYDNILQSIDVNARLFNLNSQNLNKEALMVLRSLHKKGYWNTKKISYDTLKNHYCKDVQNIDKALDQLVDKGFIAKFQIGPSYSLNMHKRHEIEKYIL